MTAPETTTAISAYGLAIARALQASGVDSVRVFRAAGIPTELSTDSMSRLPTGAVTRLSMRLLYKPGFNPLRVEFHRPMPREGAEPYERLTRHELCAAA